MCLAYLVTVILFDLLQNDRENEKKASEQMRAKRIHTPHTQQKPAASTMAITIKQTKALNKLQPLTRSPILFF